MAFQRAMDGEAGKFSRSIGRFSGWHSGYSDPDAPNDYARVCDFDCSDEVLELREGCKKNQGWGYPSSITDLLYFGIGGRNFVGQITNGVLTLYPVEDIMAGMRTYYKVSEVTGEFTVDELATAKTINDLIQGNR